MAKKVLFVCTGNTCRSSMAEGIALKVIAENPEKFADTFVTSAGTYAFEGAPAAGHAIKIAEEKGINLQDFRSKPITTQLIEEADIILAMTNAHKMELLYLAPKAENKTFLLKEYVNDLEQKESQIKKLGGLEVNDPFGKSLEVYRSCYHELYEAIEKALNRIVEKQG